MTEQNNELNKSMKELIKMYSSLRAKIKEMKPAEKEVIVARYMKDDFQADLAQFSGIAVKLYSYLGYKYFKDTMKTTEEMIERFHKMDRINL
jgi:hypothetical protein